MPNPNDAPVPHHDLSDFIDPTLKERQLLRKELAALRAANEELGSKLATLQMWVADCPNCATLRGKLRELDAWAQQVKAEADDLAIGAMCEAVGLKLRELGLVEARDGE